MQAPTTANPTAAAAGGVFIALAGPSGAGKDSLIRGARRHFGSSPHVVFARRVITRASDVHEDHDTLTPLQFRMAAERGDFALWWEANGLSYGIPAAVCAALDRGSVVVANVSRDALASVRQRFARSVVVHVTASPDRLRERLATRGREDDADQGARLARSLLREQSVEADVRIENDADLDSAIRQLISVIALFMAPLPSMSLPASPSPEMFAAAAVPASEAGERS
jgi:ribose 1,5-bisphosphokinase